MPARHPLLASSATYTALAPLLRHCLDHPARVRQYESHVSDQTLQGVLVQVACAAPAHPEPFSLRSLGSSLPVQLPACTRRDNARDAGSLAQPVLCTAYWSRVPARPPAHPASISRLWLISSLPAPCPAPGRTVLETLDSLPAPYPAAGRTVLETLGSSHHPPPQDIDMTRLSYPLGVAILSRSVSLSDRSLVSTDIISERDSTPRPLRP